MTPRKPQCEVFRVLLSSSKHSGVPKDSKSPTLEVLGFTPTLGQSGVATQSLQGERESKIGERKPGWFWDNLKIIFKHPKFKFFFFGKTNNLWRKMKNVLK
jgi:hypothetical protein